MAAGTYPDWSNLQVVGGLLMLVGHFALRGIASGALKEAGKELWVWTRNRRSRRDLHCRCEGRSDENLMVV